MSNSTIKMATKLMLLMTVAAKRVSLGSGISSRNKKVRTKQLNIADYNTITVTMVSLIVNYFILLFSVPINPSTFAVSTPTIKMVKLSI